MCIIYSCPMGYRLQNEKSDDGKCCECVPEEAMCIWMEKRVPIGTIWNDGPCKQLECLADDSSPGATRLIESTQTCPDDNLPCPFSHQKRLILEGKCCAECINVTVPTTGKSQCNVVLIFSSLNKYLRD
jgi:hypothetical protein